MAAKKTRQSDKAVYLLSANHKVRRVSLKKISERAKGVRRPKRVRAVAKRTVAEPSLPVPRAVAPAKVASVSVVAAGLFLCAALVGASWSSSSPMDDKVVAAPAEEQVVLSADVASAPMIPTPTIAPTAAKPLAISRPAETPKPRVEIAPVTSAPSRSSASEEVQPAADPQPAVVASASDDTVTISGCLDFDGKSAWLKNTSGIDTPRTRSWRSGFLKKSKPRIALVDGPLSAQAYDGRLVSVTGVLVDREMHVSSLKPIADDCD